MKLKKLLVFVCCFLIVTFISAQQKNISGNVSDAEGGLPGVNIVVKGTVNGTETDFDGNYSIKANIGDILIFSFVGKKTKEIVVGVNTTINVVMEADNVLDEVVVTAVGIKRKPDEITTAYENIKSEEITAANNPDAVQSLAGKVSGLQINTTSTGVAPNTQILLRGVRTLSGNAEALVVIDNVISTATVLSNIDPESIESINVLKGPNGAALYGSRGGNGVIVVTTKKGTKNKEKFTIGINSSVTIEDVAFLPILQDRYGKGYWGEIDAFDQGSWGPEYDGSSQPVGLPYPTFNDFRYEEYSFKRNNIKPFFNDGTIFQNSVSISGGDSDSYFTLTANRRKTNGIIPDDRLTKDFFSASAGKKYGKLSVSAIARFSIEDQNTASSFSTDGSRTPTSSLYIELTDVPSDIDINQFSSGSNADHWTAFGVSPYWIKDNSRLDFQRNISDLSAEISYEFNDNISAVLRGNYVNSTYEFTDYVNAYTESYTITGDGRKIVSSLELESGYSRRMYIDAIMNFNYKLTKDVGLKSLVGFNFSQTKTGFNDIFGTDLTLPNLYTATNISSTPIIGSERTTQRANALFANVDLSYKDYLFLNMTGRYEFDSRLQSPRVNSVSDLSFFYPSVGVSFIPTKAFPKLKSKTLHKVKVSGGYVQVANISALDPHGLFPVGVQTIGFPIEGINSFLADTEGATDNIKPEFVNTFEANLNLEFLYSKGEPRVTLDASASFYTNTDQILKTSTSSTTGLSSALVNIGKTSTDAYEVDLGFTPIKTDDFKLRGNVGFSTYKTTVEKVTDDSDELNLDPDGNLPALFAVKGEEFPLIKGSAYQRDDQGRVIVDANGVPQTVASKILGKTTPDYILNFGGEVSYKGFTLRATADYRTGHVFYSNTYRNLTGQGRTIETAENGRGHFIFPNSTVEGSGVDNTTVLTGPSYAFLTPYQGYQSFVQSGQYLGVDENFILDATAFKLREVSLSYDLPSKYLENTFLNSLSIGLSGRNLWTSLADDNRNYSDPEVGGGIAGYSQTPATRFYTMNVSLTF